MEFPVVVEGYALTGAAAPVALDFAGATVPLSAMGAPKTRAAATACAGPTHRVHAGYQSLQIPPAQFIEPVSFVPDKQHHPPRQPRVDWPGLLSRLPRRSDGPLLVARRVCRGREWHSTVRVRAVQRERLLRLPRPRLRHPGKAAKHWLTHPPSPSPVPAART
jgi:hypothetical protein